MPSDNPEPVPHGHVPDVDPAEFLRALLRISPEDAEKAREDSPATRPRKPPEGPTHDYGDSDK